VIESVARPDSNGRVVMRLVDPLALVLRDTTIYPPASPGVLAVAVLDETDFEIRVGFGPDVFNYYQANLPEAGPWILRIDDEIMVFAGSFSYNPVSQQISFVDSIDNPRGKYGTIATSHDVGSQVQACWVPPAGAIDVVEHLLLKSGVSESLIDVSATDVTCGNAAINSLIDTVISSPTSVLQMISELAEQFGLLIWWDADIGKIRIKCNALPASQAIVYNDRDHIVAGSLTLKELPDDRISEFWLHYDPRTPIRIDSTEDFRKVAISLSQDTLYQNRQTAETFSRWISSALIAADAADRVLAVSSGVQVSARFSLTPKDANIAIGDFIAIDHPSFQNASGARERLGWLVVSRHEDPPGERVIVEAQTVGYDPSPRPAFIATTAAAENYADATTQERTDNAYMADNGGLIDGDAGYSIL